MIEKINKVFNIILTILIVISLGIILSAGISIKNGNVPSVFGYSFSIVMTPSMEPTIMTDDFVISKKADSYEVGDVISFYSYEQDRKISKTHRIVEKETIDGVNYYTTKGDNNNTNDKEKVKDEDVIGVITYNSAALGSIFSFKFFRNPKNIILIVIIMLVLFMISQISHIYKLLKENKNNDSI